MGVSVKTVFLILFQFKLNSKFVRKFWPSKLMYLLCDGSMGVGRTGVFIALSIALERMRFEGVVDMFQTVRLLRTQRPAMVQTEV